MNPFFWYIAKTALCSGILTGYYWLFLRNKVFHRWNRFYLLAAVVLSLVAPLLKINIAYSDPATTYKVFRMLHVVSTGEEIDMESIGSGAFSLSPEQALMLAYTFVSLVLSGVVAANAARIFRLLRSYPKIKLGNITFLATHAPGTPFSFLHYIVWNRELDLHSQNGQQIFRHELTHVEERHTWDKLFLLLILIPCWANPVFWIIRKELQALHEFLADRKAVEGNNATELAQLILNTAFPRQHHLFTNPFFQSTIKRRIAMFTKLQNPSVSYAGRIIALPLLLIVIAAFSLKTKEGSANFSAALDKPITVVIDAGHGALKDGARQGNVYESDLTLAIAQKIKAQNRNSNIRIIMTREDNQTPELKSRVQVAADNKADLFISIHVNAAPPFNENGQMKENEANGIEISVPSKNSPYQQQSEAFGSLLVQELGNVYPTKTDLVKKQIGIYVLNYNVCPSILIECGYLTNQKDRDFITKEENQTLIANKILDAIGRYGVLKNKDELSFTTDTTAKRLYNNKPVTDVQYFEWPKKEVHVLFADGTKEAISVAEAEKANLFDSSARSAIEHRPWAIEKDANTSLAEGDFSMRPASVQEARKFKGLVMLNDKIFDGTFQQLPVSEREIAYISFMKGSVSDEVKLKPGDSILAVSTKAFIKANQRTDNEPLFTEPEVAARFPDTSGGWTDFLIKHLNSTVPVSKGAMSGTYKVLVGFIVDTDGKLYDIKPFTHYGYGMEEEVVRILRLSPDWKPAQQNGKIVTSYVKQPVTFVVSKS